jgi:tetratricopeptide (TPR) repeat protein
LIITEKLNLNGDQDLVLAKARDNFAWFLAMWERKFDEAEELELKAVAVKKKLLPEGHKDIATSLNNLAQIYAHRADVKMGDLDNAEVLHRQALGMRQKALGAENNEVANSLENLALLLRAKASTPGANPGPTNSMALLTEAESCQRQALAIRQKIFSEPKGAAVPVSIAFDNLGLILRDEGRLADAEEAFRKSKEARRQ